MQFRNLLPAPSANTLATSGLKQTGITTVTVRWGPAVRGASVAFFEVQNGTITGSIDGRAFLRVRVTSDTRNVVFVDNGEVPALTLPTIETGDLQFTLQRLQKRIAVASELSSAENVERPEPATLLVPNQLRDTSQDRGHFSSTAANPTCQDCVAQKRAAAERECEILCIFTILGAQLVGTILQARSQTESENVTEIQCAVLDIVTFLGSQQHAAWKKRPV